MKKTFLLLPAAALAIFGVLLAMNVVNFEEGLAAETSPIDRWVMIFSFAGAAAFVGLASADTSSKDEAETTTGRAAAAQRLSEGRPDPTELPSKPGSLLKKQTPVVRADEAVHADDPVEPIVLDIEEPIDGPVPETAEPFADASVADDAPEDDVPEIDDASVIDDTPLVENVAPEVVAVPAPLVDPVDAELQSLIDDDQMQEINDLVAAAESDPDPDDAAEIVPGGESVEPLVRLELRLADYDDDDLKRVVKESESVVIAEMVRSGQLSSEGALTEKDIASMVFLAYTSDEMLTELRLRKSIDADSGQAGLEASTGSDFAPLKNIE